MDALDATEMALLPGCGGSSDYSESPDGKWKALQCINAGIAVYNRTDYSKAWYFSYYDLYGLPYEHGNRFGHVHPLHWSPEGRFLYFVPHWTGDGGCAMYNDGSALYRLDLSTGAYSLLIPPAAGGLYGSFSFSNGDTYVAHIELSPTQHAVLTVLDLGSNARTDIPLGDRYAEGGNLIWSPDNRQVLFSARSRGECETMTDYLVLLDLEQRTQHIIWQGGASVVILPVSWEAGGKVTVQVIVLATGSGGLFTVSLPSGQMRMYTTATLTPTP